MSTDLGHLVRRFVGSWSRRPPGAEDLDWVRSMLLPTEWELWAGLDPADQRHSLEVTRRMLARGPEPTPERAVVAGGLLHDVGKRRARLGPIGRSLATVWGMAHRRRPPRRGGRWATYLRHEELGAIDCRAAGSERVTVALVERSAAAPGDWLHALRAADDSI